MSRFIWVKNSERQFGKKNKSKEVARNWELYMFLLIPIAYLVIFDYIPMYGVQIAFRNYTIRDGIWDSAWVGMNQFKKFLSSHMFPQLMYNTLNLSLYSLFAVFPIPILLALALNSVKNASYRKFVQMATYLPYFISVVVLVGIMYTLFNPRVGLYGVLYKNITGVYPDNVIGRANLFPHLFVWSGAWQNIGYNSIIYIAALSAIDSQLYEAAIVDGATRFQRTLHIDIPGILPTIVILFILRCGNIMSLGHEKALLMQNDLNMARSQIISTYVYEVGLKTGVGNYSYATAIGLFNSVINLAMLVSINKLSQKLNETSLW